MGDLVHAYIYNYVHNILEYLIHTLTLTTSSLSCSGLSPLGAISSSTGGLFTSGVISAVSGELAASGKST